MKKSLVIFSLFSLMMVLTSFTAPNEIGGRERGTSSQGDFTVSIGGRERGTSSQGD